MVPNHGALESGPVTLRLVDRRPALDPQRLIAQFLPPPHFAHERFSTYIPDPGQPSQGAALASLEAFAARVGKPAPRRGLFRRSPQVPELRLGVYLDGGFGVGKTHLLASLWHAVPAPKTFGTFVGYTHLVGALGFEATVNALSDMTLVCIDEFELDDPGDTVLMSTLLNRLVERGVMLAATSNTLPDKLGEGRFAAEDFLREIQGLAAHFDVLRVDGEDYRHRGLPDAPAPLSDEALDELAAQMSNATLDDFADVQRHLATVHPSRYGALVDGVDAVLLRNVRTITDQAAALRFVVLVDRLYDRDIPIRNSGVPLDALFTAEMLKGGYRKKYFRALSRAIALGRQRDVSGIMTT